MNTPYSIIYKRFLNKISDFYLPQLTDEELAAYCNNIMQSALVKVFRLENDLTDRNDELGEFNSELLEVEIEVIALMMVAEWVTPQLNNAQLVKQFMGTKDEKTTSQANHINALRVLREDSIVESQKLRRDWGYRNYLGGD